MQSYLLAYTQLETRRRLALLLIIVGSSVDRREPTTQRHIAISTSQLGREADLRFGRVLQHYLLAPSLEIRAQGERLLKRRSRSVQH